MDNSTLEQNIGNFFNRISINGTEHNCTFKILNKDSNDPNLFNIQKMKPHYQDQIILDYENNEVNSRESFLINQEWFNEEKYIYSLESN